MGEGLCVYIVFADSPAPRIKSDAQSVFASGWVLQKQMLRMYSQRKMFIRHQHLWQELGRKQDWAGEDLKLCTRETNACSFKQLDLFLPGLLANEFLEEIREGGLANLRRCGTVSYELSALYRIHLTYTPRKILYCLTYSERSACLRGVSCKYKSIYMYSVMYDI